ncbi:MAG TPA: DUF433 domain-containing protein [Verrucomicrobiae bacterium]|nr:DUF433 domain-containing protein [Verrucomicrobiae bacterium]
MQLVFTEEELKTLPISADPEIMHGALCFRGTRVPVDALWGNLASGMSVAEFVDSFPTVKHEDAVALIEFVNAKMQKLSVGLAAAA